MADRRSSGGKFRSGQGLRLSTSTPSAAHWAFVLHSVFDVLLPVNASILMQYVVSTGLAVDAGEALLGVPADVAGLVAEAGAAARRMLDARTVPKCAMRLLLRGEIIIVLKGLRPLCFSMSGEPGSTDVRSPAG